MKKLSKGKLLSVCYHDVFDYPLKKKELNKWTVGKKAINKFDAKNVQVSLDSNYLYIKGRECITKKREENEATSRNKKKLSKKYGLYLSSMPTVKLVAITGALAMNNAKEESDMDLMIVTKKGTLWSTRFAVWIFFKLIHAPLRKPLSKEEKDKLCLNVWIDETDLIWPKNKRNIYTAHEIAQVVPLLNKGGTYEKFMKKNSWAGEYWPNALKQHTTYNIQQHKRNNFLSTIYYLLFTIFEPMAYKLQRFYMKPKVTIETITKTRALFHPNDMTDYVLKRLQSYCIPLRKLKT
jgi:D-beta-D-heptose 7-phosphate kinase/D-beta-D-heptose 1-phosphate adenosyltransferase